MKRIIASIKKWWSKNYQGFSIGYILNLNFGKNKKSINEKNPLIIMYIKTLSSGFYEFKEQSVRFLHHCINPVRLRH